MRWSNRKTRIADKDSDEAPKQLILSNLERRFIQADRRAELLAEYMRQEEYAIGLQMIKAIENELSEINAVVDFLSTRTLVSLGDASYSIY